MPMGLVPPGMPPFMPPMPMPFQPPTSTSSSAAVRFCLTFTFFVLILFMFTVVFICYARSVDTDFLGEHVATVSLTGNMNNGFLYEIWQNCRTLSGLRIPL